MFRPGRIVQFGGSSNGAVVIDVTSGAPVVARKARSDEPGGDGRSAFPWMLLGVHSAKLDVANRDSSQDESLDLNFAWYADILLTLTQDAAIGHANR